jgi:hypothetical protein
VLSAEHPERDFHCLDEPVNMKLYDSLDTGDLVFHRNKLRYSQTGSEAKDERHVESVLRPMRAFLYARHLAGPKTSDRIGDSTKYKIGKSASETLALLTVAYGEYAMEKSSVFEWHRRFKEGREDVKDVTRSGQSKSQRTDANVDRVRTMLFGSNIVL